MTKAYLYHFPATDLFSHYGVKVSGKPLVYIRIPVQHKNPFALEHAIKEKTGLQSYVIAELGREEFIEMVSLKEISAFYEEFIK